MNTSAPGPVADHYHYGGRFKMTKLWGRGTTSRLSLLTFGGLAAALALGAGCGGSKLVATDGGAGHTGGAGSDGGASDGTVACPAGGTGKLVVAVNGLPTGTVPMVRVMGGTLATPMPLTPGTEATLDAGGGYALAWRRVKVAAVAPAIVGKAFYLSNMPFDGCIKSGVTTTVTVEYTQEPGSEKLWVTVSDPPVMIDHKIAGFNGADIMASGTKDPSVWKSKNFTGRGAAGAVDSSGNLWVPGGDRINRYDMATLGTSTDAAPGVTLTQPAGSAAKFAAFDASGNLWVSRGSPMADDSVVRYDASQLVTSGTPTPTVVLKSSSFMDPAGIAFDEAGDLWVADQGNDKVLMFLAAHVAASSTAAADVVLTAGTGAGVPVTSTFTSPIPLAFDKAGNLWVGYISNLVKLTVAQQSTSANLMGATGPAALTWGTGTGAFAFDESGGLWMGGPGPGKFQRLPSTELAKAVATSSVMPVADIVIDSTATLGYAESLVMDPAPSWSHLHDDF
jgi:hypothetical protein